MNFRVMAWLFSVAAAILAVMFIFNPQTLLHSWNLDAPATTQFMARRLGVVYLGIAVMFFLGRSAPPSPLRNAVCIGIAIVLVLLPVMSLIGLQQGLVGKSIIGSIIIELVLAAGLISTLRR